MRTDSLTLIYATDFHGNEYKYDAVLKFALQEDIKLIHLGGDMLPKGSHLQSIQKHFIQNYLKDFYAECNLRGIEILAFFGNDDIYTRKKYFRKYATLLDEVPYEKNGYIFKAYPYVLDYPFGLKTACKSDYDGWKHPEYVSPPSDFDTFYGHVLIADPEEYFLKKGTLKDDLKKVTADNKTIMAMHMPPQSLELDVCYGYRRVGSKSILDWIYREQPLLFLSGHIHENYEVTKIWKVKINNTLVIQPGQRRDKTTIVLLNITNNKVKAKLIFLKEPKNSKVICF